MWDDIFFFILSGFFKFSIEDKHVFYNAKSYSKAFNKKKVYHRSEFNILSITFLPITYTIL